MAIFPISSLSQAKSRSAYLCTLPLWRRCLAMLNWRPVYDIEQETARLRESDSRIARFEQQLLSCSSPAPSTGDSSPT